MTKRWRLGQPKRGIRFGWLVLLALLAQIVVIYVNFGDAGDVGRFVLPFSYLFLLAFVIFNRQRVGFLVIGIGALLNFAVISANGGLMPITPENVVEAGLEQELAELELGDPVPDSKNVLLEADDAHLQFLSDRLVWDSPGPLSVFSIGDVVIGAGLIVVAVELLAPVLWRASRGRPSLV